jgi:hypothetical protein
MIAILHSRIPRVSYLIFLLPPAVGLMSCSSVSRVVETEPGANVKLVVQSETRWPTSASWWTNPDATALTGTGSQSYMLPNLPDSIPYARVIAVSSSGESATVVFRHLRNKNLSVSLVGPPRLADMLGRGQQVGLTFDHTGKICAIDFMPELRSWSRTADRHHLEFKTLAAPLPAGAGERHR